ncbi:MAG: FkbM family methyltransferase [Bernardetiaceae bacterium]
MLKKIFLRWLPYRFLHWVSRKDFPYTHEIVPAPPVFEQSFIEVPDEIAERSFYLCLRSDSFMEYYININGLYGDWEKESLKIWAFLSKKAQTIIDIGANTGIYTMVSKNNHPDAFVLAVEPIPINFQVLEENILQNKLTKVVAQNVALSNYDGTSTMYMLKDQLNFMTSLEGDRYATHPEIKGDKEVVEVAVEVCKYHTLHAQHHVGKIDLLKIDVEGHELAILEDMRDFLERDMPVILLEVIGDQAAESLDRLFKEIGYTTFISIDEINLSKRVEKIWDNDHHNFLICLEETYQYLQSKALVK